MGRYLLLELLYTAAGLLGALGMAWAAAWAYPLGADVIWACGIFAAAVTLLVSVGPIRRALVRDRGVA